jgi:hypothetical protein
MKTYVLTLSKNFPASHPKAGQATDFNMEFYAYCKILTIRANYPFWIKRFEDIERGDACLSIR